MYNFIHSCYTINLITYNYLKAGHCILFLLHFDQAISDFQYPISILNNNFCKQQRAVIWHWSRLKYFARRPEPQIVSIRTPALNFVTV